MSRSLPPKSVKSILRRPALRIALAAGLLILLGGAAAWVLLTYLTQPARQVSPPAIQIGGSPVDQKHDASKRIFAVTIDEPIRVIEWPTPTARLDFYREQEPDLAASVPQGPPVMLVFWKNGSPQLWQMGFYVKGGSYSITYLIFQLLHVPAGDLAGEPDLADVHLIGDVVADPEAGQEQLLASFAKLLSEEHGFPVKLSFRNVARPVVVFGGNWDAYQLKLASQPDLQIELKRVGSGQGNVNDFALHLSDGLEKTVVFEALRPPAHLLWSAIRNRLDLPDAQDPRITFDDIANQTGLTWSEQTRMVRTLFVERAK
jgi:hypothetical protein